ncbi:MAG: hypothetical protein KDI47_00940 [Gammaproteobacteria bacterium]|nr:hypothetical protein [Gammaproteobacteria bacterium]
MYPEEMEVSTDSLLNRLESGVTGSPELSKAIMSALGWRWECIGCPGGGMWKDSRQVFHSGPLPKVSEQADAARKLIPENIFITAHEEPPGYWLVRLYAHRLHNGSDYSDPLVAGRARTLPLALCSAAIKLKSMEDPIDQPQFRN